MKSGEKIEVVCCLLGIVFCFWLIHLQVQSCIKEHGLQECRAMEAKRQQAKQDAYDAERQSSFIYKYMLYKTVFPKGL